jgi:hypothetical protein
MGRLPSAEGQLEMGVYVLIRVFPITPDSPPGESGYIRDRQQPRQNKSNYLFKYVLILL